MTGQAVSSALGGFVAQSALEKTGTLSYTGQLREVSSDRPLVSVIIPVYNAADHLKRCLDSLASSSCSNYECIVIDDASTDDSAAVAENGEVRVIRSAVNTGPAAARNRAVAEANGDILLFLDSDVCVPPDTIQRVIDRFDQEPEVDAVIGSYDDQPGQPDFLSQYRNLLHHFVHQHASEDASTFWSGCGAIRREALLSCGGFDERYRRPSVEDIELGYRLKAEGRSIRLDKSLRVKHLKKWTIRDVLRTDIFQRGIPWSQLILRHRDAPADLNVKPSQRVSVVLVYLVLLSCIAAGLRFGGGFLEPLLFVGYLAIANYRIYRRPRPGFGMTALELAGGLAASVVVASALGVPHLIPGVAVGLGAITLQRYRLQAGRRSRTVKFLSGLSASTAIAALVFLLAQWPLDPLTLTPVVLLGVLVAINAKLYAFLTRRHDLFFTITAIPFHLLYFFYCGLCFGAGIVLHWTTRRVSPLNRSPGVYSGKYMSRKTTSAS